MNFDTNNIRLLIFLISDYFEEIEVFRYRRINKLFKEICDNRLISVKDSNSKLFNTIIKLEGKYSGIFIDLPPINELLSLSIPLQFKLLLKYCDFKTGIKVYPISVIKEYMEDSERNFMPLIYICEMCAGGFYIQDKEIDLKDCIGEHLSLLWCKHCKEFVIIFLGGCTGAQSEQSIEHLKKEKCKRDVDDKSHFTKIHDAFKFFIKGDPSYKLTKSDSESDSESESDSDYNGEDIDPEMYINGSTQEYWDYTRT